VRQQTQQIAGLNVNDRQPMHVVQAQLADSFQHRRVWTDGEQRTRTNVGQQL